MYRFLSLLLLAAVFAMREPAFAQPPMTDAAPAAAASTRPSGKEEIVFRRWLLGRLVFPEREYDAGLKISVTVSYQLSKTGRVRDVELRRTTDEDVARQVLRLLADAPDRKPQLRGGKPVAAEKLLVLNMLLEENPDGTLRAVDDAVYRRADTMPRFGDGGPKAFSEWVHAQVIAADASADSAFGHKVVRFVIGRDGAVGEVCAAADRNDRLGRLIEAIVRKAPAWTPALLLGERVRIGAAIPVLFGPEAEREKALAERKAATGEAGPLLVCEEMPAFRGGNLNTFRQWAQGEIHYPKEAYANRIEGRVVVSFVVETDGALSNIRIMSTPHPLLSEEVERALRRSPRWTPGQQDGKPVRVKYTFPLDFKIP